MAAISEAISPSILKQHLRPFDMRRDLSAVADLVELCFADTLDPDGRDYLRRMRSAGGRDSDGSTASILRSAQGWASSPMTGYVWVEDGQIVGNVSLIPYFIQTQRHYLVANVAVHPKYRRLGIARRMTEQAVAYVREHRVASVWLHVREENQAALDLYHSLNFIERAVRTTWLTDPDYSSIEKPPGVRFFEPIGASWPMISAWLLRTYPPQLSWHMPFHLNTLRPGLIGAFLRFMVNSNIRQWGVLQENRLAAAAAWQATGAHANLLWLAAPENANPLAVSALLEHIRHHSPTRRAVALDYPARQLDTAIRSAGFHEQQTLVWMELPLDQH